MRRRGVVLFSSYEQEVTKQMLEKVVAAPTIYSYKYEERTILSACPVPHKCYCCTT